MQYIKTKYLGPTNHRGSRIKATASYAKISATVDLDNNLGIFENHQAAAKALLAKLDWPVERYYGGEADDHFVFVPAYDHTALDVTP